MSSALSPRLIFIAIVCIIIGLFGYALYTQYVDGLDPCPLCMSQRLFYALTAFFALLGAIHGRAHRVYGALVCIAALLGAAVAARQVWLQHLPPELVPACGPSLEHMLRTLPFGEVLVRMIKGDGNCAVVDWRFLGLSMAAWSLLWFLALAATGFWLALRKR